MRFVKENNSVFIIGENSKLHSFERLNEYGLSISATDISTVLEEKFQYSKNALTSTRLHSKKTKCILECLHLLEFTNIKDKYATDRIGIYINGSHNILNPDFPSYQPLKESCSLYQIFKKNLSPTYNIKNILGIIPGHIAIFHDLHGPTFSISSMGVQQTLNKASFDLNEKIIDLAIVGFINTYEDEMVIATHIHLAGNKKLTEAAGVILLTRENSSKININANNSEYFGYLEKLIS
jgi:hypothetical protein